MLINNDITNFKHLSNFTSLKDFNNNFEMWLAGDKKQFTKKEFIIVRRLSKYSAKVYGVSNISVRRLLQAVEQHDNVTVSEATFHRAKRKAAKLGIITIHSTKRTDNSQSSNLYVFNRYSSQKDSPTKKQNHNETLIQQQKEKREMTSHEADKNFKTNMNNNNRKEGVSKNFYTKKSSALDHNHVSQSVPKKLIKAIKPFFNTAADIYEVYKRLTIATKDVPHTLFTNIDDYVSTFKQTIYRLKSGIVRGDYLGYLYGAFKNKANELGRVRYSNPDGDVYFDWVSV